MKLKFIIISLLTVFTVLNFSCKKDDEKTKDKPEAEAFKFEDLIGTWKRVKSIVIKQDQEPEIYDDYNTQEYPEFLIFTKNNESINREWNDYTNKYKETITILEFKGNIVSQEDDDSKTISTYKVKNDTLTIKSEMTFLYQGKITTNKYEDYFTRVK